MPSLSIHIISPHTWAYWDRLKILCQGRPEILANWIREKDAGWTCFCTVVIFTGAGLYGASMGLWRDPLQALYSGIKFPLLILLTLLANAMLNGMFTQLLGLKITFRETTEAILMSFTIVGMILGALTPISLFILQNTSPMSGAHDLPAHLFIKLTHVAAISYAGTMGNLRLYQLLHRLSGSSQLSRRIIFAWLGGNLFLGSQLAWILRPFMGSPFLEVAFLREDAFQGNFYENLRQAIEQLL